MKELRVTEVCNKSTSQDRYRKALFRNLNEIARAILERRAIVGLVGAEVCGMDFIRLSYDGLRYDMVAHAIKVLEDGEDVRSFWYLKRQRESEVKAFARSNGIDLRDLETASAGLKHIRDKTHFHIDKKSVGRPGKIWEEANVTGNEFHAVLRNTFAIMDHLYHLEHGKRFNLPPFDGAEATRVAQLAAAMRNT